KNRKAHFTLLNIDAPPAALNEIERQQRISEDVLRYLTVRVHEHEDGPSAMMRKADRDCERDDRGFGFRDRDRGGFRDRDRGEYRRDRDRERDGRPPLEGFHEESSPGAATGGGPPWALALSPTEPPPAILSPPQDLSVFRRQCPEDRLQGREALAALRLRARQDRAESDYGGFRQEAGGAGAGHQTRPLSRIIALRDPL